MAQPSIYGARLNWVEQVYYIASIVGHELPVSDWDQGKPGQYCACHAEKKLVAYFLEKHVFLPQNRELDRRLRPLIYKIGETEINKKYDKVCCLEQEKMELESQRSDEEDRLLDDCYDEEKVEKLKKDIQLIDEDLSSLTLNWTVASMRAERDRHLRGLNRGLMELSKNEPATSLKEAVILSNNGMCPDCEEFIAQVNGYFQLEIEVTLC